MASESKKRKSDKKLHWGKGQHFMKWKGKGIKRLCYFTSSQRQFLKKELHKELNLTTKDNGQTERDQPN
jgi:hypothetical protein